ncbi:amidohydrolase [Bacterioplanoides sp. SCSIO 12839]|uniref:amidohydrolase n=1 Tax=Bacterioplanoides sp. SCSIO 12839 TaxID=2829569 RepID=UPI0021058EFB|nr:amidohydrolase family protein [Bacterioplanoides sp. SCSIO 12839]UTW47670.1 amidohydrolase [Bacterioplanoides sp. SCSIO 12839]
MLKHKERFRKNAKLLLLAGLVSAVTACSSTRSLFDSGDAEETPVLVVDANIITMNPDQPRANAMIFHQGEITAVGDEATIRQQLSGLHRTYSLSGQTVVPGFIETHDHIVLGSLSYGIANVEPFNYPTLASALEVIASAKPNDDGWILAFGADPQLYEEKKGPTRDVLDKLHPDVPVLIFHLSGHGAFANSEALRRAGIDNNTPNPDGGYFEKDEHGELTGYLSGQPAFFQVHGYPPTNPDNLLKAANARAKEGVTTASEMGFMDTTSLELARATTAQHDFPIRVMGALTSNTKNFDEVAENIKAYETDRLTIRFGKTWTDGSPQGGTAFFSHGYHDPEFGGAEAQGSQEHFNEILNDFYQNNLWPAVHANGDGATDVALAAIESAQASYKENGGDVAAIRPHLIHALYTRPEQIQKAKALNTGITFFPTHVYYWGDLHYERTVGPDRSERLSAMADAYKAGIQPTMHNDPPVTPVDPIFNMWITVNRTSSSGREIGKDQAITAQQALAAYTTNAAYQFGVEDQLGSLEVGKKADFVVLDADPLSIDAAALRDIEVQATVVDGRLVYAKPTAYDRVEPPVSE